MLATIGED